MKTEPDLNKEEKKIERTFELERIVFFSDAVYAIAITLMALELRPPTDLDPNTNETLLRALLEDWPHFFAFALSFWIIAVYWVAHHRYFRYIVRYDEGLIWRNLVMLFFIALIPFSTLLIGEDGDLFITTIIYAASIMLVGLSGAWLWRHASKNHRLVIDTLAPDQIRQIQIRAFTTPVIGLIVILLAPFIGSLATTVFFFSFVIQRMLFRMHPLPDQP